VNDKVCHKVGNEPTNRWLIVVLLVVSVCINYIDRGSLSVAAPMLKKEFSLSPRELGYLLSAFFWSYTVCQLVVGWLVDRYDVKWIYAGGFLIWSLAMAATGAANSFAAFFGVRLLLGIGESVFLPSVSRILVRLFPAERRGLPNAFVDVGTKIGPGLSVLIGGLLLSHYGWRGLFVFVGLGSLLWLWPWMIWMPGGQGRGAAVLNVSGRDRSSRYAGAGCDGRAEVAAAGDSRAPLGRDYFRLLRQREVWGTSLGMFALGYVWIFLITWLPTYLVKERGYSMEQMAVRGSLPYWGMAVASLTGGWASDRWIAGGGSATLVRKTFALTGLLVCAVLLLPAGLVADSNLAMGLLIAACVALGLFTSNVWAITQTLAGTEAAGKWTGIQNFVGNLGGVVSPIVAGVIVEKTGSFFLAFVAAAGMLVLGAVAYLALVRRVEGVEWGTL
jgi:MFS family permease